LKERELIKIIQGFCRTDNSRVIKSIGDDCAVIAGMDEKVWLITMDTLVESIHFNLAWHPPEKLGRKCVSVNVSDIAAMGGRPMFVLLSLGLPAAFDCNWFTCFSKSLVDACDEYGCILIGGDTVKTTDSMMITLTVIGEAPAGNVVYRGNANIGDIIWIDAPLGLAAAGLELCKMGRQAASDPELHRLIEAHLNPDACLELGTVLGESGLVNAMMDISDGIATDLAHLCSESAAGAILEAHKLPIHSSLQKACDIINRDPLELILSGGEDYHLLFTASPLDTQQLVALVRSHGFALYPVGVIEQEKGVRLLRKDETGKQWTTDISYQGFDHFVE
jgi:thiamine-monophosphate kinase